MKKNKKERKMILHKNKKCKKDINQLYIKYINALVKSENLQNKLEKTFTNFMDTPNHSAKKKARYINNSLNKTLVKVMVMQNMLNYIASK